MQTVAAKSNAKSPCSEFGLYFQYTQTTNKPGIQQISTEPIWLYKHAGVLRSQK